MKLEELKNPVIMKAQTTLNDTDSAGHFNHISYINYMERIRSKWYGELRNWKFDWDWILGDLSIKYLKESKFGDQFTLYMWCSRIGNKSWSFSYLFINQSGEIVAEAKTAQVTVDYKTGKTIKIPDDILEDISSRLSLSHRET